MAMNRIGERGSGLEQVLAIIENEEQLSAFEGLRYRLVGQRTQKQYALGDPVKVKLVAVRQFERELDFELVP